MLNIISLIADILGIATFVASIGTFIMSRNLLKHYAQLKIDYNKERLNIQSDLMSLRNNILIDKFTNREFRSKLRETLYADRNKYWMLYFPFRLFKIQQCLFYIKGPTSSKHLEKLCNILDYLIATLNEKGA